MSNRIVDTTINFPLTWMFCGRGANSKINMKEPSQRIVYKNYVLSFEELLKLDELFKIHHANVQSLGIKFLKQKIMYLLE